MLIIQIALIACGAGAVFRGAFAFSPTGIRFGVFKTPDEPWTGAAARKLGLGLIIVGLSSLAAALFGLPFLAGFFG